MVAPLVVMRIGLKPGNRFPRAAPLRFCCGRAAGFLCCAEAASIPNDPFRKFRRLDAINCSSLLLRFVSRIPGWFFLLEVFPTTLSFAQETHQVGEVLLRQRVLIRGHVGTAVLDLRGDSLIVDRLSRYQSRTLVQIPQRRGSRSGGARVVVVANP